MEDEDDEEAEDEDVATERARVERGDSEANGDIIRMTNLRKVYPPRGNTGPKIAVVNTSLGIPEGAAAASRSRNNTHEYR